jgi:hypothetical protein
MSSLSAKALDWIDYSLVVSGGGRSGAVRWKANGLVGRTHGFNRLFMALSQTNIDSSTPMGATLVSGGATFRVWGPLAQAVYLNGQFAGVSQLDNGGKSRSYSDKGLARILDWFFARCI